MKATFFLIMALAMLLIIAPTSSTQPEEEVLFQNQPSPLRGTSRFLGEKTKKDKALKCNKNPKVCLAGGSPGPDCCKKKCVSLMTDRLNCGACGHKCKYTEACCKGKCVNLALDKRHCGKCNNRCNKGDYCTYGLCSYAN